jgi:hypothetical protein
VNASLDIRFLLLGLATGAVVAAGARRAVTFLLPSWAVPSGPEPAAALPSGAVGGLHEHRSRP